MGVSNRYENYIEKLKIEHIGNRFYNLLITDVYKPKKLYKFKCICDCGKYHTSSISKIINGQSKSCVSCSANRSLILNGKSTKDFHLESKIYQSMISRCYKENNIDYHNYGGRGITVSQEWRSSNQQFFKDMGKKPNGYSLDRIDNNKGYSKDNCRWTTRSEQNNNKRTNVILTAFGESMNVSMWAKKLCIKAPTIRGRYYSGKSHEECLSLSTLKVKGVKYNKKDINK